MTLGALFYTATKMMKSTRTDQTLRAIVGQETELCFVSEGNLPFHSFHTWICFFFVLFTKITDCHPTDSFSVAVLKMCLLKFMPQVPIINCCRFSQRRLDLKNGFHIPELCTRTNSRWAQRNFDWIFATSGNKCTFSQPVINWEIFLS
jgi:uncharacterized membrane protein